MLRATFLHVLLFAASASALFSNTVVSFSGHADEPIPSRFLLMDDPMLKIYSAELEPSISKIGPAMSMTDVSQVIGAAMTTNHVNVEAEAQEGNNLEYQLDLRNRKLNLLVNVQDQSLELKLSSEGNAFNKEAVFASDKTATEGITTFLTDSFQSIKGEATNRMLLDKELQTSEALFNYLKEEKDFAKAFGVSFPLSQKNKFIVVTSQTAEPEGVICYIEIDGESPKYLKIRHNMNEKPDIELFKMRHALFIRKLVDSDTLENVYGYIKDSISQIIDHIDKSGVKKATLEDVAVKIKALFAGFIFKDYIIEGGQQKAIVLLAEKDTDGSDSSTQIVIYPMPAEFIGVEITVKDRQYQAEFPLFDFAKQLEFITPQITKILDSRKNLPFNTIQSTVEFINKVIKVVCPTDPIEITQTQTKLGFTHFGYQAKVEGDGAKACVFSDSRIGLVQYNFGFMHFIHVVFENALLKTEYMIAPNHEDLEQNVTEIFVELKLEIEAIKAAHAKGPAEPKLLPEKIENVIKTATQNKLEETKDSSPGDYKFLSADQQQEIKVKLTNGYYRIAFMKKADNSNSSTNKFNVLKEIYIPEVNGYDQIARIQEQTEKFVNQKANTPGVKDINID